MKSCELRTIITITSLLSSKGHSKGFAAYRGEIAALKRRIAGLESRVKKLGKGSGRAQVVERATPEKTEGLRFRVTGFASLRKKLGICAAEMG
jgi:hypothetical protein